MKDIDEIYLPQIVSGCTKQAEERAAELFKLLTPEIIRLDPLSAELAKLFTNTWRYVQFAVANQFFTMANDYGADFYGLPRNTTTMTLVKESWTVPEQVTLADGTDMVPFFAGQTLQWKLRDAFQS